MRIRSLKHKQLIALVLVALTPLFALTASMWMQAQNSDGNGIGIALISLNGLKKLP